MKLRINPLVAADLKAIKDYIAEDNAEAAQKTVDEILSWSHDCELLSISDADKRSFYEKEAVHSNWSVRELKRQIDSSLFERL